jgi:DNA recombination protein RmuC
MTDMVFGLPVLVLAVLLACAIGWLISYVRSQQIVTSQHVQLGKLETERDLLLDRITEHEQLRDKQGHEFNQIQLKHTELLRQHSALSTSLDEKQLHFTEQLRQLSDSREALKREFENLANEILERKGKAFKELNQESIYHLLKTVQS